MSVNCGVSLNPGFQFQILSPKLQDKIMNWKAWVQGYCSVLAFIIAATFTKVYSLLYCDIIKLT